MLQQFFCLQSEKHVAHLTSAPFYLLWDLQKNECPLHDNLLVLNYLNCLSLFYGLSELCLSMSVSLSQRVVSLFALIYVTVCVCKCLSLLPSLCF
jgi:hypothetical protein